MIQTIKKIIKKINNILGKITDNIHDYNEDLNENPFKKKYSLNEKIMTSMSFLNILLVTIIPGGDKLNVGLLYLSLTTFLYHLTDKYYDFNDNIYNLMLVFDWLAIINLACIFLNINIYLSLLLLSTSFIYKLKDIVISILYLIIIYKIIEKDIYLGIYLIIIMTIGLIKHQNVHINGWNFEDTWCWHLCSAHLFISMKLFLE